MITASKSHWNAPSRGMATLTVVMIMFFVMAMVAAYTNRNLIFEQRTSANSFRAAQALAAAEGGIDWTLAMLNGGKIDDACISSAGGPDDFRTRYLSLQFDGTFAFNRWASGATMVTPTPSCMMTDAGPQCSCPQGPTASLNDWSGDAPVVFRLQFQESPTAGVKTAPYPGVVSVAVRGCTSAIAGNSGDINGPGACHIRTEAARVDGQTNVRSAFGLVSALPVTPAATLTAGGRISIGSGSVLKAANDDPNTSLVLHAGQSIVRDGTLQLTGPAGSTGSSLEAEADASLQTLAGTPDAFFQAVFGMLPADYRHQPAAVRVDCATGCTATGSALASLIASNPSRVIWIQGDLDLNDATPLGSANQPVMLVVAGNVTVSQPIKFTGFIYASGQIAWGVSAAGGFLVGALVANGDFIATGDATFAYDREVMRRLRQSYGSFVRVPGSWRIWDSVS